MAANGPILLLEDDTDDQEILTEAFESLHVKNELKFFSEGRQLIEYLSSTDQQPFLIISDVNLPGLNGIDTVSQINKDPHLRKKSIPFVFLTTSATPADVNQAYEMMIQGYFQKGHKFDQVRRMIELIIGYWSICKHPNNV